MDGSWDHGRPGRERQERKDTAEVIEQTLWTRAKSHCDWEKADEGNRGWS